MKSIHLSENNQDKKNIYFSLDKNKNKYLTSLELYVEINNLNSTLRTKNWLLIYYFTKNIKSLDMQYFKTKEECIILLTFLKQKTKLKYKKIIDYSKPLFYPNMRSNEDCSDFHIFNRIIFTADIIDIICITDDFNLNILCYNELVLKGYPNFYFNCNNILFKTFITNYFNKQHDAIKIVTFYFCFIPNKNELLNYKTKEFSFIDCNKGINFNFDIQKYNLKTSIYSNFYINYNSTLIMDLTHKYKQNRFNAIEYFFINNHSFDILNLPRALFIYMSNSVIKDKFILSTKCKYLHLYNTYIDVDIYIKDYQRLELKYIILENLTITNTLVNIIQSNLGIVYIYIRNCKNEEYLNIIKDYKNLFFINYKPTAFKKTNIKALQYCIENKNKSMTNLYTYKTILTHDYDLNKYKFINYDYD